MANVRVDLRALNKFAAVVASDLRGASFGPIRKALKQWAARFRAATRKRFIRMASSGWKRLVHKRKRGSKKAALPLRNTGTLLAVLETVFTKKPGQLEQKIPFGVRVGYGGDGGHPDGDGVTVAQIAEWHQTGAGNLPIREIIVEPGKLNPSPIPAMRRDMLRALKEMERG